MKAAGAPVPRSRLMAMGITVTSTQMVALAREVCTFVREQLGDGRLEARLIPHKETLVGHVFNERQVLFVLIFLLSGQLRWDSLYIRTSKTMLSIPAPDLPEALHLIGIILEGLAATITDIGVRDEELNLDVCRPGPRAPDTPGLLDRCNFRVRAPVAQNRKLDELRFVVSGDGNYTPTEVFNRASRVVHRICAGMRGAHIRAHLYGYRDFSIEPLVAMPGHGLESPGSLATSPESGAEGELILVLQDEINGQFRITFSRNRVPFMRGIIFQVSDIMQSLHIAGMLLDAVGVESIEVGCRTAEKNEDVLAWPLSDRERLGEMVSASNFVAPLPTSFA